MFSRIIFNLACGYLLIVSFGLNVTSRTVQNGISEDGAAYYLGYRAAGPGYKTIANAASPIKGLKVVRTISYNNEHSFFTGVTLVSDNTYSYLSTPDGLYRTSRLLDQNQPLQLIGFANKSITNLYVHNNALYVLKVGQETNTGPATDHSFLRSENHGQSFIPMDKDLEDCIAGYCLFLTPTKARFVGNLIFLNAGSGRNLLVSKDQGVTWSALSGSLDLYSCSEPAIEFVDNRVLMGGECPLDFAYIWGGELTPDLLGWADGGRLKPVTTPPLSNRNVQTIERRQNSSLVFAGVEGGLLKSIDGGKSFRFVVQYPSSGNQPTFPYIRHVLFPASQADFFIVGGFDKAKAATPYSSYLAYSTDHGESWVDFSHLTHTPELAPYDVGFITEDPSGRILTGLIKRQAKTITIAEILIEMPAAPTLLTEADVDRAIALDSITMMKGPFSRVGSNILYPNDASRISLFARRFHLLPGEDISALTVEAENQQGSIFRLPVEFVGKVRDSEWLTQIVVALPDELAPGDFQVRLKLHGAFSNKASITIKP